MTQANSLKGLNYNNLSSGSKMAMRSLFSATVCRVTICTCKYMQDRISNTFYSTATVGAYLNNLQRYGFSCKMGMIYVY